LLSICLFPRRGRVVLAALGILDGCRILGGEITHDFTIRAEIMVKPFDAQSCAFGFWTDGTPQELDVAGALLQCLFSIAGLTNLGLQALLEVNLRLATIDHLSNGYDVL
jgi:hypothetical protein